MAKRKPFGGKKAAPFTKGGTRKKTSSKGKRARKGKKG